MRISLPKSVLGAALAVAALTTLLQPAAASCKRPAAAQDFSVRDIRETDVVREDRSQAIVRDDRGETIRTPPSRRDFFCVGWKCWF
jgi:hypothetical protein